MVSPIVVSNTMRIPMQNRSIAMGDPGRIEVLTLRARKPFFGKQRYDNLMMLVEIEPMADGRSQDIVFGRCVAFFRDKANEHFVAVHWYEKVQLNHPDHNIFSSQLTPHTCTHRQVQSTSTLRLGWLKLNRCGKTTTVHTTSCLLEVS